jgi:hypothetical protein
MRFYIDFLFSACLWIGSSWLRLSADLATLLPPSGTRWLLLAQVPSSHFGIWVSSFSGFRPWLGNLGEKRPSCVLRTGVLAPLV